LMPKFLHLETFFGDTSRLRSRCIFQGAKLVIIASQFCSLIIEMGLSYVERVLV
jgi:hypothetical protein